MRRASRALAAAAVVLTAAGAAAQPVPPASAPAPQPATTPRPQGPVVINMRAADIRDVAEQVSRVTGRTIVLDPTVQGQVTVTSATPLGPNGVWDLFQSVVRAAGFAVVRSGSVWRVVPQAQVAQSGSSVAPRRGSAPAGQVVTRVIRLRNLPSDQAVRVLRPLVATFGSVEGLTEPNAIVVTDYADNVARIQAIAQALDTGGAAQGFESIQLRHANAEGVGQAITRLLGDGGETGGPRVAVDERANIVIVRGSAAELTEARRVAQALDVPGGAAPSTRVFRLRFADAETVASVLQGVLTEGGAPASNPVARSLGAGQTGLGRLSGQQRRDSQQTLSGVAAAITGAAPNIGGIPQAAALGAQSQPAPAATPTESGSASAVSSFTAPELAITASPELNAIVARGSASQLATVDALIRELDVRRPQVVIEAAIVEITGERGEQLGVQLAAGQASRLDGGAGATSFSNLGPSVRDILVALGSPAAAVIGEGLGIGIGSRDDFSILINALGTSSAANLLSTPSVTVLDNEPAEIVVGQNVPFRTGSFTTDGGGTLSPFTTIEREDVGITLRIVPRVHEGDTVRLQVSQEVSSLVPGGALIGAADLITNRRSIQTTVLADDGRTVTLGGLITDDQQRSESRVPVLADIPVIGNLFRSRSEGAVKRTLFIFLRARILRDSGASDAVTRSQYDRLRIEDATPERQRSLLMAPEAPRLRPEIEGVY